MDALGKFDEMPSMILQDKETKRYGHTPSEGRTDNMKIVYPPTNTVCGGYNYDPVLTLNYFTARSNFGTYTFLYSGFLKLLQPVT